MSAVLKQSLPAEAVEQRHNIYTIIHKALRAFMADTLLKIGRMDAADDSECADALAQTRKMLALCSSHLHHENTFVHPAIDRVSPGYSARTAKEHVQHEAEIADLLREIEEFETTPGARRPRAACALYLHLSTFVGDNFSHMAMEETENHAVLVAGYSNDEVLAIEHALVAALSPETKFLAMSWMLPYANASERAALLGGIKRGAPRELFEVVLGLARDSLNQRDFFKLERALA